MHLDWKPCFLTSCFHAAELIRRRTLVDRELQAAISEPAASLARVIGAMAGDSDQIWRRLISYSGQHADASALAEATLQGLSDEVSPATQTEFTDAARNLEEKVRAALPRFATDLAARERPLREQWEARGPGMMLQLARRLPGVTLRDRAEVWLVHPAGGGGGDAHPLTASVRQEAVLAHPIPSLPEPLRLAWLLAQLSLETQPLLAAHESRVAELRGLALIPAALQAGEYVELCKYDPATVAQALNHWLSQQADRAAELMQWWKRVENERLDWEAAVTALAELKKSASW